MKAEVVGDWVDYNRSVSGFESLQLDSSLEFTILRAGLVMVWVECWCLEGRCSWPVSGRC